MTTGIDAKRMRRANADAVLRILYAGGGAMPLATVAARTGLSRRTVELILATLEGDGWVRAPSQELHESGRGRPARQFEFRADAGAVLAVDVEHDRSTAYVADLRGRPLATAVAIASGEPDRAARITLTRQAIADALRSSALVVTDIGAVAIATPGNVTDDGVVAADLSMQGWRGVALRTELCSDFGCPVVVENNAKLGMLAELSEGATPGADHMLWLMLEGAYSGMGILVNGEPYRGVEGASGEIFWAKALGLDAISGSPLAGLGPLQDPQRQLAGREALRRAHSGDPAALAEVDSLADVLASALATLSWILAPRFVVLGGTLSHALGELLTDRVAARMKGQSPPFTAVLPSAVGADAVVRGAVRAALQRFDWAQQRPLNARTG